MFSGMQFKHYSLFLFFGITIILIYIKIENADNILPDYEKTTVSSENIIQYFTTKAMKFKNSEVKKSKKIGLQDNTALNRIQKICTKYNLTSALNMKSFLFSPKNKALYCWIRKVASTSFTKIFFDMENQYFTDKFYRDAEVLAPKNIDFLNSLNGDSNIFKFLVVRHPFERLVSSYRDRIEDNSKFTAQAWIYVPKMFHITRPELFYSNSKSGGTLKKMFYLDKRLKLVPTFKEFVTYLIQESPSNYDNHWNQFYNQCSLCEINYNFIVKLQDCSPKKINDLYTKLNINREKDYLKNLHTTQGGSTDFNRTCKYFKTLSREIVLELYEKYKIDFEMFDYNVDKYSECFVK